MPEEARSVWIHKGNSWTRMFSPTWAMEVTSNSNSNSDVFLGVLTHLDQVVLRTTAPTVAMCAKAIEDRTRIYFAALLVDLNGEIFEKGAHACMRVEAVVAVSKSVG
jgi:hypothetical protein